MGLRSFFKRKETPPTCSAVILAAGSSERMGADKIMMKLGAMPVLARTVLAFENNELVDEIIIVTRTDRLQEIADLCYKNGLHKVKQVIGGGATRMESALAGVSAVRHDAELIAIHDGARPLVSQEVITRTILAAKQYRAAVPAVPSTDTLKAVDENGMIVGTVDRATTVRVQTPQIFEADLIKGALTKAAEQGLALTDDCAAMDMMGVKTRVVEGDPENIKMTTPNDLIAAEAIVKSRGDWYANRTWV
ncbi:MAG: 2-C-methyl-D-erythritol 4-phosphate cytidylyltransferase [Oscillospiraceae bacterium]|nr:2-C-methyl-D-erythritol 4-phosphate cytidylyltransferase [Oscillospiraceae bacterium]